MVCNFLKSYLSRKPTSLENERLVLRGKNNTKKDVLNLFFRGAFTFSIVIWFDVVNRLAICAACITII